MSQLEAMRRAAVAAAVAALIVVQACAVAAAGSPASSTHAFDALPKSGKHGAYSFEYDRLPFTYGEPVHHFSAVTEFDLSAPDGDQRRLAEGHSLLGLKKLELSLAISGHFERRYEGIQLTLHSELIGKDAVMRLVTETGEILETALEHRAYKGLIVDPDTGNVNGWVRLTLNPDQDVYAYIFHAESAELTVLEPTSHALKHIAPSHAHHRRLLDLGTRHVAHRHGVDRITPEREDPISHHVDHILSRHEELRKHNWNRRLALMPEWMRNSVGTFDGAYGRMHSDCPASQKKIKLGVACDAGFYQAVSGGSAATGAAAVAAYVTQLVQIVNVLYTDQINVFIELADVYMFSTAAANPTWTGGDWNLDSASSLGTNNPTGTLLDRFRAWTNNEMSSETPGSQYGLWHLLTNDFPPPGTVGLAYKGVTCTTYNSGWTTFFSDTWGTFAHELGHNVGGSHTMADGGIMSYDSGPEYKFKGSNPTEICGHVKTAMERTFGVRVVGSACYTSVGATCGNYLIEPGEECDAGPSGDSCCTSSCALHSTAYCTRTFFYEAADGTIASGTNQCCTATCKPTGTQVCGVGDVGFCINGHCNLAPPAQGGSWCRYSNAAPCDSGSIDQCKVRCSIGTTCYDASSQGSFSSIPLRQFSAGTVCGSGPFKSCSAAGVCVSATDPKAGSTPSVPSPSASPPAPKSLTITTPGETWIRQSSYTIQWSSSNVEATANVHLRLVGQAGQGTTVVVSSTVNDGSHIYTVPTNLGTGNYRVCVRLTTNTAIESCSTNFAVDVAPDVLSVSTSSTSVTFGAALGISWSTQGAVSSVKIELLETDASGSVNRVIASSTPDDGSYTWTTPASSSSSVLPAGQYRIRVSNLADVNLNAVSPVFSILEPKSLSLVKPANGGIWTHGSATSIVWTSTGQVGNVHIRVIDVNNADVAVLSANEADDGAYAVSAAQVSGIPVATGYRVAIRDVASASVVATSGMFQVSASAPSASVTITSPSAGSSVTAGNSVTVTWTTTDSVGPLRLTYQGPASGTIGTGVSTSPYSWSTPSNLPQGSYVILIQDSNTPEVQDVSGSFTVAAAPAITVTSPTSADQWRTGRAQTISWAATSLSLSSVEIILRKGDTEVLTITPSAPSGPSTGTYSYNVPSDGSVVDGADYSIMVRSTGSPTVLHTGDRFTIAAAPTYTIMNPSSGSEWAKNAIMPVQWTRSGIGSSVSIQLLKAGVVVRAIASPWYAGSATNTFQFTVPGDIAVGNDYVIRVTSLTDGAVTGDSNAFSIVELPTLEVATPSLGQSALHGRLNDLSWTSTGAITSVRVSLWRSGAEVAVVDSSTANDGAHVWLPPSNQHGTGFTVRIADTEGSASSRLFALIRDYPGTQGNMRPNSYVQVTSNGDGTLKVSYQLRFRNEEAAGAQGGAHIHAGLTCESAGGHYYSSSADPWLATRWTHQSSAFSVPTGAYGLADNLGHAFVVHAADGTRIGCGVLTQHVYVESEEFAIEVQRSLNVTLPTPTTTVVQGAALQVAWDTIGDVPSVDVRLETSSNGALVTYLARGIPNEGRLATVAAAAQGPPVVGTGYRISVVPTTVGGAAGGVNPSQVSSTPSSPFSITARQVSMTNSSRVTFPVASTVLRQGEYVYITWEMPVQYTLVRILLIRDGEVVLDRNNLQNDGVWGWQIPVSNTFMPWSRYRFDVLSSDGSTRAVSSEFAILTAKPSISITDLFSAGPALSGNDWTRGVTERIQWTAQGEVGGVVLDLMHCGDDTLCDTPTRGVKITSAAAAPAATEGQFEWTVPYLSPPLARQYYVLRLSSSKHPSSVSTISQRYQVLDDSCAGSECGDSRQLAVARPVTSSPQGGLLLVTWSVTGRNRQSDWTEKGAMIHLFVGGNFAAEISSYTENDGSFSWAIPSSMEVRSDYQIQVYLIDDSSTSSRSRCPPPAPSPLASATSLRLLRRELRMSCRYP